MSRPLLNAAVLAIAIVLAAFILRSTPVVQARAPGQVLSFRLELRPSEAVAIRTVPLGRRLILTDFVGEYSNTSKAIVVLADDETVGVVTDLGYTLSEHFTSGLAIEGGKVVSLLLGSTESAFVTICGYLE